jgi:hypothetical protein
MTKHDVKSKKNVSMGTKRGVEKPSHIINQLED